MVAARREPRGSNLPPRRRLAGGTFLREPSAPRFAAVVEEAASSIEGELGAAEFYFRRAEKIESSKYAALFGYGTMLVAQKKYRAAVVKFELAQKLHPTTAQAKYIEALRRVAGE